MGRSWCEPIRARADLILDGTLKPGPEITLSDGSMVGVGDTIISRRNDGSITIRPPSARFGNSIVLPADYVAEHVDLGYAITAHRAQGITIDTAHVLVEPPPRGRTCMSR